MADYKRVSASDHGRYPGTKRSGDVGGQATFEVLADEQRPLSDDERALADRMQEVFDDLGLTEKLAKGGVEGGLALNRIASAIVAAIDEGVPQYARGSVGRFAGEVARTARLADDWAVNADGSGETLNQRKGAAGPRMG